MNICNGKTKKGINCKRKTNEIFCKIHHHQSTTTLTSEVVQKNKSKPSENQSGNDKLNNEIEGNSFEVALCEIFQIPYENKIKPHRYCKNTVIQIKDFLKDKDLPSMNQYVGENRGKVDFKDNFGKTFSIKSNKKGMKICPQIIGQATIDKFCEYFKQEELEKSEVKEFIYQNIGKIYKDYLKCLFCCDYLIWLYRNNKNEYQLKIFEKQEMWNKYLNLDENKFTWTRKLENWNESNTLKWKGISLGEFQIHNHRNCIKMRWNGEFFLNENKSIQPTRRSTRDR